MTRNNSASKSVFDLLTNIPRSIEMFDKLNESELKLVARYLTYRDVDPGEYVFKEWDSGFYMCFVAHGDLEVLKKSTEGKNVVISRLQAGLSIGEMAVIDNYPRSASVRAKTEATLVILSRDSFNTILDEHPAIGVKLLRSLAHLLCHHLRKTSKGFADQVVLLKKEREAQSERNG
jgi:CRP/FNR family transcriptional regulator, cyclic AMP receptor protein